jgi:Beta-propeller repeat
MFSPVESRTAPKRGEIDAKTVKYLTLTVALFVECVALLPRAHGQGGVPLWTNRFNGEAVAVAVDKSGKAFVTGRLWSGVPGEPGYYATVAYSGSGEPLWTNLFGIPGVNASATYAKAIVVDSNGNVYVTGDAVFSLGFDYATVAYSNSGTPLWTNRYTSGGGGNSRASANAVDSSGNVFVTGSSYKGGNVDYATIKYSSAGVPLWTNRYDGPMHSFDGANSVGVDAEGNVFVTGTSHGSAYDFDFDSATIKYSSAGVPVWTNRYNGPGNEDDGASAIAVNANDDVVITGYSFRIVSEDGYGYYSYATIKYSNTGLPLWTNYYSGAFNTDNMATALVLDRNGNVFVTGESWGFGNYYYDTVAYSSAGTPLWTNRLPAGAGNPAIAADKGGNIFVMGDWGTVAYSNTGVPLWTNQYNGPGSTATAMAVDTNGDVFVTGQFWTGVSRVYGTIKYSSSLPQNNAPLARIGMSPLFAISPNETNLFVVAADATSGRIVLDGSESSDADNDLLQFSWFADGQTNLLASGAILTNKFTLGPHTVTLVVSDGKASGTTQATFEVITPSAAVGELVKLVEQANIATKNKEPLLATLYAAISSFDRDNLIAALNQLSAFENKVRAQIGPSNAVLAGELIANAQQILAVVEGR